MNLQEQTNKYLGIIFDLTNHSYGFKLMFKFANQIRGNNQQVWTSTNNQLANNACAFHFHHEKTSFVQTAFGFSQPTNAMTGM